MGHTVPSFYLPRKRRSKSHKWSIFDILTDAYVLEGNVITVNEGNLGMWWCFYRRGRGVAIVVVAVIVVDLIVVAAIVVAVIVVAVIVVAIIVFSIIVVVVIVVAVIVVDLIVV